VKNAIIREPKTALRWFLFRIYKLPSLLNWYQKEFIEITSWYFQKEFLNYGTVVGYRSVLFEWVQICTQYWAFRGYMDVYLFILIIFFVVIEYSETVFHHMSNLRNEIWVTYYLLQQIISLKIGGYSSSFIFKYFFIWLLYCKTKTGRNHCEKYKKKKIDLSIIPCV